MTKKASIITLCYNQLETATKPFIKSIYQYTNPDLFELIIVNNASSDGTYEYLEQIKNEYNNIKVIHNTENLGYSKGNNQGMELAEGDYLIMLNNDTLFTPHWLEGIIDILANHPEIGILSTKTNHCGGDRQLIKNYKSLTPENYLTNIDLSAKEPITYSDIIFFFCWALRREVMNDIGLLDETFGLAWFEDADYTYRCLYKGYKCAVANNIFIYHNHSQTSSKLGETEEGQALFYKNKAYFENKHKFYIELQNKIKELEKKYDNTLSRRIFSISPTKYGDHKIVRLLGLKFKI